MSLMVGYSTMSISNFLSMLVRMASGADPPPLNSLTDCSMALATFM
jgi:hypothetical protein